MENLSQRRQRRLQASDLANGFFSFFVYYAGILRINFIMGPNKTIFYSFALVFLGICFLNFACQVHRRQYDIPCSKFHSGTFYYQSYFDTAIYRIVRTDTLQVEILPGGHKMVQSRITWINDCEFELRYLSNNFNESGSYIDSLKATSLMVKIVDTRKEYYIFQARVQNLETSVTDTMWLSSK